MIYGKLEPGHIHIQVPGLIRISRTVQWIREAAGRNAIYVRRALEETGLTTIYLTAFMYWMNDNSSGSAKTATFLDRCLAVAENVDRMVLARLGARDKEEGENAPQSTY
jgi:hypothetical protein